MDTRFGVFRKCAGGNALLSFSRERNSYEDLCTPALHEPDAPPRRFCTRSRTRS